MAWYLVKYTDKVALIFLSDRYSDDCKVMCKKGKFDSVLN
jgi:hypothetical protein